MKRHLNYMRTALVFIAHGWQEELRLSMGYELTTGLCSLVSRYTTERHNAEHIYMVSGWQAAVSFVCDKMIEWEGSTKNDSYPVPAPSWFYIGHADEVENAARFYDSSDKYTGEYGDSRRDLARFLIAEIDKLLASDA